MNEFFLTLPSNTNPEDKTGHFSIHLPYRITLKGQYEVAMTEILYPYTWDNIFPRYEESSNMFSSNIYVVFKDGEVIVVTIPQGNYETINELLAAISIGIKRAEESYKMIHHKQKNKDNSETATVKTAVEMFKTAKLNHEFYFHFGAIIKRVKVHINKTYISEIHLSNQIQYMLGYETNILKEEGAEGIYPPDLKAGVETLYVYTNIIEPQIVGNTCVPLLRLVHVHGTPGEFIEKIYTSPHYLPVIVKDLETINIAIKSDSGQLIGFNSGKTVVKLHFRKKRLLI